MMQNILNESFINHKNLEKSLKYDQKIKNTCTDELIIHTFEKNASEMSQFIKLIAN
jgi:hypothetical protein